MQAFSSHHGLVAPIDRHNVDTDAIIPKQFLKSIKRTGFGPHLFDEWRYLDPGEPGMDLRTRRPNPEFVLNQPRYAGASILLARGNFGCGSSREHAPWALQQFGFRVVIASSFADIFYNNALKNGLLPVVIDTFQENRLFEAVQAFAGYALTVDLPAQTLILADGSVIPFAIEAFRKHCLIEGLDEIGLTLTHVEEIKRFEAERFLRQPWLAQSLGAVSG